MTGHLYILGYPVGHSKSPAMHNAAYKALGLDWDYDFMSCEHEADARAFLDTRSWVACNVTMPYKPLAYQVADHRAEAVELAGGANVLVLHEGELFSDNTDGVGCVAYLRRIGVDFDGAKVAVCGTGPTSLAIMHACAQAGAGNVALFGRNLEKTRAVLDHVAERGVKGPFEACDYDCGREQIAEADVIVDATPLGMAPGDPAPFDTGLLSAGQTVLDVVYGHGETTLIAAAAHAGCTAVDGAGMLVAQAVETVVDLARITRQFDIPEQLDLFDVMARAAGFDL